MGRIVLLVALSAVIAAGAADDAQAQKKRAKAKPVAVAAATYKAPRTWFGAPDLQGIWTNGSLTVLELQPGMTRVKMTEAEARAVEEGMAQMMAADAMPTDPDAPAPSKGSDPGGYNAAWLDPGTHLGRVKGEYRGAWITEPADGKVPYSEKGRADMQALLRARSFDNPENRPIGERCLVGFGSNSGPPMLNVLYNNNYQIQQAKDSVAILVEMPHDVRLVRIGGARLPAHVTPWMGDSIGRWEGETLVVETTNINPKQAFNADIRHRIYLAPGSRVVERFTRIAADEILYQFEVSHPDAYTQTWKGEMPLRRTDGPIYEYACHEGNHSLPGILAGARQEEDTKANAGGKP